MSCGDTLVVLKGVQSHLQEYFAAMAKVFCHDFQEGACVYRRPIGLPYRDWQASVSYGPDKHRCRSRMQAYFCCDEGFLLRQASSFAKTESPSVKFDPYKRSRRMACSPYRVLQLV
ncbi:hypothetical protein ABIE18_001538 [Arthrobacter sp. 2762]